MGECFGLMPIFSPPTPHSPRSCNSPAIVLGEGGGRYSRPSYSI